MPHPEEPARSIAGTVAARNAEVGIAWQDLRDKFASAGKMTGMAAITALTWTGERMEDWVQAAVAATNAAELIAQSMLYDLHRFSGKAQRWGGAAGEFSNRLHDRYNAAVEKHEAVSPTWHWGDDLKPEDPRGFSHAALTIIKGVLQADPRLAQQVADYLENGRGTLPGEVFARSLQALNNAAEGKRVSADDLVNLALLPAAFARRTWERSPNKLRAAFTLLPVGAAVACGVAPQGVAVESPNQPTLVESGSEGVVQSQPPLSPAVEQATPTPAPEVQASPTSSVVGLMVESPNKSGWLPPTIEDTILTSQAGGGKLPPQLQPLIDQAQATIAATGFAQARVETVTNGQAGDAFRAAFVFRIPEGIMWAQGSAYPSQLNPDGSVSRSYAYVLVPGSADARIEWTAGADGSLDTETTLVKHTANLPDGRQAALLYWHTTEQTWKPIGGYPTAQEFVAVGDTIYQFSPEDGSAVEIGVVAGLQSLNSNNGRVEATDANGQVFWFEEGRFVNEALLAAEATAAEAQRVAEYVEANTEPINRVEMPLLEFRASDRLQEAIWERLPDDVQALGDKPLYMMVYDVGKLTEVIGSLSIFVAGHEDKVPLADKKVVFTFLSGDEEVPDVFMPFYAGNQDGFRYGAFEGGGGEIHIVIKLSNGMSTFYQYDVSSEWGIVTAGVVLGLNQLSGNRDRDVVLFEKRFYIDTPYDDGHPDHAKGMTWLPQLAVGNPRRGPEIGYLNSDYYRKIAGEGWIPPEYLPLILPNG